MPAAQVPVVARPKQFGRQYSQLRELSPFPALKRSIFSFVRLRAMDFGLPQQPPATHSLSVGSPQLAQRLTLELARKRIAPHLEHR